MFQLTLSQKEANNFTTDSSWIYQPNTVSSSSDQLAGFPKAMVKHKYSIEIVQKIKKRIHQTSKKWYTNFDDIHRHTEQPDFFMVYGIDHLAPNRNQNSNTSSRQTEHLSTDKKFKDHKIFLDEWRHRALIRLNAYVPGKLLVTSIKESGQENFQLVT